MNNLNRIAHLPLNIEFDADRIFQEIQHLNFTPYNSWEEIKAGTSIISNWESISLYSIYGKDISDPQESWIGEFIPTQALKLCPYLREVLDSLGAGNLLARIEKFKPNSSAGWHSHVMESKQPEWISVLQLPIVMPEESKFSVVHFMDYRCSDFSKPITVYESTYKPGKVYCFNSYHYHNAFNYGDSPMFTVRVYVDNRGPIGDILQKSIQNYTGEYIASSLDLPK